MKITNAGIQLLTFILLCLGFFTSPVVMSSESCPSDKDLLDANFVIHPSAKFDQLAKKVISKFVSGGDDIVYETAGPIRSRYGHGKHENLILFSYDDVTTPESTHYGDLVFVLAHDPEGHSKFTDLRKVSSKAPINQSLENQLVEVRWWNGDRRQIVYDDTRIRCATPSKPMAENALY